MNTFYVYAHCKPHSNLPFYIGKGRGKRAYTKEGRNAFWKRLVNKHGFRVEILFENLQEEHALLMESAFINMYGRRNVGTGILVNLTDGGEGMSGLSPSPETREKISNALKGRRSDLRGRHLSKTHKDNLRKALSGENHPNYGKSFSEDRKIKMSDSMKGKTHSEETKEKIRRASKGKIRGPYKVKGEYDVTRPL